MFNIYRNVCPSAHASPHQLLLFEDLDADLNIST